MKKYNKQCKTCGKEFIGISIQLYCKRGHRPADIRAKDKYFREFGKVHARFGFRKISLYYKNEIRNFYKNKPKGMTVDHIIPLKHESICGLHVPWNLQYLSLSDNSKKSNKFK